MTRYSAGMTAREVCLLGPDQMRAGVLSTKTLHLACEMACHHILAPLFGSDDTSVGIHNDIWFWGDAVAGELLHAEAVIAGIDRNRILFNVYARAGVREIARGTHRRALVSAAEFEARLPRTGEDV